MILLALIAPQIVLFAHQLIIVVVAKQAFIYMIINVTLLVLLIPLYHQLLVLIVINLA